MEDRRHTSTHYEKELKELKDGLLYLGGLAENAIKNALQALLERDSELAKKVIADDTAIDRIDSENEDRCIRILALRQPAARDLRFIATAIKINGHLERIGDMAVNIAEKVLLLNEEPQLKPYIDIPYMAEITQRMIRQSMDSLIREDVDLANQVRKDDEIVDNLNEQVFRELLTFMIEDPRTIRTALIIMQISKNLERISDHAEGIADMVIYMVTGKSVRHNPSQEPKGHLA
ncbi:phosphate uptake regulator, PhoU [Syntrophus gentianae]|uniref:Phosphate-specific transport system accessory protein PhoU n=1 Tax=Syntrophus gentianae TaxID=43775 RepID=A0A1H7WWD5_9BACT|nr:phosphate signaling complex protein PhoU [Syntrophus gentianae]SEM25247.1 phosphate uptake regulator, PhoU [Syntrophus gentianae]